MHTALMVILNCYVTWSPKTSLGIFEFVLWKYLKVSLSKSIQIQQYIEVEKVSLRNNSDYHSFSVVQRQELELDLLSSSLVVYPVLFFFQTSVGALGFEKYLFFKDLLKSFKRLCVNLLMKVKIRIATGYSSNSEFNMISKALRVLCIFF